MLNGPYHRNKFNSWYEYKMLVVVVARRFEISFLPYISNIQGIKQAVQFQVNAHMESEKIPFVFIRFVVVFVMDIKSRMTTMRMIPNFHLRCSIQITIIYDVAFSPPCVDWSISMQFRMKYSRKCYKIEMNEDYRLIYFYKFLHSIFRVTISYI